MTPRALAEDRMKRYTYLKNNEYSRGYRHGHHAGTKLVLADVDAAVRELRQRYDLDRCGWCRKPGKGCSVDDICCRYATEENMYEGCGHSCWVDLRGLHNT